MVRERSWIRIPLWAQMTLHEGDKSILHLIEEASNHRRKEVEHISLVGLNKEDLDKLDRALLEYIQNGKIAEILEKFIVR